MRLSYRKSFPFQLEAALEYSISICHADFTAEDHTIGKVLKIAKGCSGSISIPFASHIWLSVFRESPSGFLPAYYPTLSGSSTSRG
jgi:hypothetical protein